MRVWFLTLMALGVGAALAQQDRGALATAVEGEVWRV